MQPVIHNSGAKTFCMVIVPENTVEVEYFDKPDVSTALIVYLKDKKGVFNPGIPSPILLPLGQWELLGKASLLSSEQKEGICEVTGFEAAIGYGGTYVYKNYSEQRKVAGTCMNPFPLF